MHLYTLSIAIHPCDPPVLLHNALGERRRVCHCPAWEGEATQSRTPAPAAAVESRALKWSPLAIARPYICVSLGQDWSMGPHAAIESFNLSILGPTHFDLYPFYFYLDLFTLLLSLIILASGIEFWPFAVCTASKFNWSKPCIERKTTPSLQFSRRQVLGKITVLAVSMFKGRILSATGDPPKLAASNSILLRRPSAYCWHQDSRKWTSTALSFGDSQPYNCCTLEFHGVSICFHASERDASTEEPEQMSWAGSWGKNCMGCYQFVIQISMPRILDNTDDTWSVDLIRLAWQEWSLRLGLWCSLAVNGFRCRSHFHGMFWCSFAKGHLRRVCFEINSLMRGRAARVSMQ